jgi:hypothetical protein
VWFASAAGILIGELFHGPSEALLKLVAGMFLRMAIPLAACVVVQLSGGPLAAAGFVFYVMEFYFVALPIDTLMAVSGTTKTVSKAVA